MDARTNLIYASARYICDVAGKTGPLVGIVLGSGLGKLGDNIKNPVTIPYKDIPGFPVSTAAGHKGNFIIGELGGKRVIAMQGRFHYYEGYSMEQVTLPIRVMKALGTKFLFVSNAAGGCNPDYKVGDMVVIKDHISLFPNPLIGPNMEEFGTRFPDMTCAYDPELRKTAFDTAREMGIDLKSGVYFGSTGPTYETPAEVRFYRTVGADLLGMSTIPEVIVGRHCGMRVFGMSVVTNISNTSSDGGGKPNDGNDVVVQADKAADNMSRLFAGIIGKL